MLNNGTTNGNKLIWWLLSMFAAIIGITITTGMSKISSIDSRINAIEVNTATIREKLSQIDLITNMTRTEQIDRTMRFGDMNNKIIILDIGIKDINARLEALSKRVRPESKQGQSGIE